MEGSQGTGPSQACDLEVKDNQEHLMVCEGYEDLRGDADLGNKKELVEFFNSDMGERVELGGQEPLYSSTACQLYQQDSLTMFDYLSTIYFIFDI